MHEVGEKIVYGSSGIMEIVDIKEEIIDGSTKKYYVLHEFSSNKDSQTYVPVDNKKLVRSMRPLMTADEARALLSRAESIPVLKWQDDNRIRSEQFRKLIDSGEREDIVALIKTIYEIARERRENGKKNYLADENLLKRAEKMLVSEISAVLDISGEDAFEILQNACGK